MNPKKDRHLSKRRRRVLAFAKDTWKHGGPSHSKVYGTRGSWKRAYDDSFESFVFWKDTGTRVLQLHVHPEFRWATLYSCQDGIWEMVDYSPEEMRRRGVHNKNVTTELVNEVFV